MHCRSMWFKGVLVVGLAAALSMPAALAEKMPVYKLKGPQVDKGKGRDLFLKAMGGAPSTKENEHAVTHRSGEKVVEVDKRSGHIFMGDMSKLWNPKAKANLPDKARAKDLADKFLKDNRILPNADKRAKVNFSHHSETMVGGDTPGRVDKTLLDRQVNYQVGLEIQRPGGSKKSFPIVGGGAKFQVSLGDRGSVIGFQGGWREITGIEAQEEIKPEATAVAEFKKKFGNKQITNIKTQLAYYAAPAFEKQEVMAPVWVVDGMMKVGNENVPTRTQIIAATKFGPKIETGPPAKTRGQNDKPHPNASDGDEAGPGNRSWYDVPGIIGDALFPPAYADASECGTEWIGTSQGLPGSSGNKQGFVDQCRAAGWSVNFDYGDNSAWERDWRANDDSYVDGADLVFYTGHANQNGWVLNSPDDTFLHYNEIGGGLDYYGRNDMEWLIIAACGPMQSTHFTTNTTNAFNRWRNIFDGLHVFLGYGSVTYDNTSEGRRFMELTRAGWNVIDAWFRTAREIQRSTNNSSPPNGPTIYVTAMYAHNGDHCARYDHLWGMGSGCADVTGSAQRRTLMWSGT
jgi:hypothetical protein